MIIHSLAQGSIEWLAHRRNHFNASDAAAMMGVSPYKTRTQLIHEIYTGMTAEVDAGTQHRFDNGHRFERLARPLAEKIIGQPLYPVVGSKGKLSASFDGLTMDASVSWEHKSLNDELRAVMTPECNGADLPIFYRVQMQQQSDVAESEKTLFSATKWQGDSLEEERHCWYMPDPELSIQLAAGWEQLERDVLAYVPPEPAAAKPLAKTMESLPALAVSVKGEVTESNLAAYRDHAMAVLSSINRDLNTDQDFATAKATVKWCDDVEKRIAAGKEHILGQTKTIDAVFRTMDEISAEARRIRLDLDKLVTRRETEVKESMVLNARAAYNQHIAALKEETGGPWITLDAPDFPAAIKGKRNLALMQDALDTALAAGKVVSDASARSIRANLATIDAAGHPALFADRAHLVGKAPDDLVLLIKSRIDAHKAAEAAKEEALREKLRQEEREKLEREQAEAARVARVKAEAEEQAALELARKEESDRAALAAKDELAAAKASEDGAELSPAAQALNEAEGAARFASVHRSVAAAFAQPTPNVVQMRSAAPAPTHAASTPPTLKLGAIAERLGFALSADFLRLLGFDPAAKVGAHGVYHEASFPLICAALVAHIEAVQAKQAA